MCRRTKAVGAGHRSGTGGASRAYSRGTGGSRGPEWFATATDLNGASR